MKKALLTAGIILITAGALSLIFAALCLFGYFHVLDGSPELYSRLRRFSVLFFALGGVLTAAGIACFGIRTRL